MKIFVLGDSGIDRYHIGVVRGLSAEAPIPVVDVGEKHSLPAMAGNVAANLQTLGADVHQLVSGPSNSVGPVPLKNRLLTQDGHQLARWDENDECVPYRKADLLPLVEADALIVADYGKGSITDEIVNVVKHATFPVFVDTKRDPSVWIGTKAVLFPNLAEYKQYQRAYSAVEHVVLKQGAEGMTYLKYGVPTITRPAFATSVQCVNGAGDTVIAAFAIATMLGLDLARSLEFASAAAANVVEQPPLDRWTTVGAILDRLEAMEGGSDFEVQAVNGAHDCGVIGVGGGRLLPAPADQSTGTADRGNDSRATDVNQRAAVAEEHEQLSLMFFHLPSSDGSVN